MRIRRSVFPDYLAEDNVDHTGLGDFHGIKEFHSFVRTMHRALPDFQCGVQAVTGDEEGAACIYRARGTHDGELMGAAPIGNPVVIEGCIFARLEENKLVETWDHFDILSILRSLELISPNLHQQIRQGTQATTRPGPARH